MFRKSRTVIRGVELPEEFSGASVINNVAIANGKYAAVTREGDLITGEIPESGRIEVDGSVINYSSRGGTTSIGGSSVRFGRVSMNSVSAGRDIIASSGGFSFSMGRSDHEYEIDKGYEGVKRVDLNQLNDDIILGFSEGKEVIIRGRIASEPKLVSGELSIRGLEGELLLPNERIDLDLDTKSGDISGKVSTVGRIKTLSGDINLDICAPLMLEAKTLSGDVGVEGMLGAGRNRFKPPVREAIGELYLRTLSGDIDLRYVGGR